MDEGKSDLSEHLPDQSREKLESLRETMANDRIILKLLSERYTAGCESMWSFLRSSIGLH